MHGFVANLKELSSAKMLPISVCVCTCIYIYIYTCGCVCAFGAVPRLCLQRSPLLQKPQIQHPIQCATGTPSGPERRGDPLGFGGRNVLVAPAPGSMEKSAEGKWVCPNKDTLEKVPSKTERHPKLGFRKTIEPRTAQMSSTDHCNKQVLKWLS